MRPTHLVLVSLLCVLLSPPTMAQTTPPPLVATPEEPKPPQGELIPREHTQGSQAQGSGRVFYQLLGGVAASAATLLSVNGLYALDSQDCDGFFCSEALFLIGLGIGTVGITVAPPLAIWLIGERYDDRGRFWPSLAGGALGTAAAVLSLIALAKHVSLAVNVAIAGVWPVVGSMILYELTRAPAPSEFAASGPRVLPMMSTTRHGSLVCGLAGFF